MADDGVYQYYYNAFAVPVPAGAEDVVARSGGGTLPVTLSATEDPSTAMARISFPDLLYRQTRGITLEFTVPGAPPRSDDWTRVGRGYATFVTSSPGDPGRNRVEVVAPEGMSFVSTVDGFERTGSGSTDTWTLTENTDATGIWAVVSLRDPDLVDERVVDVDGTALTLESFPDDTQWTDFVADVVTDGIPTLERLVGTPWPGGLERIREDATPSLRGYDGWFDPDGDEIVVGENLDEDLILHELSHAWLSGERFDERWQYEGLAQVVAERAVRAGGGRPFRQPSVGRGDADAVPLNSWGGGAGSRSTAVEAWAYPASYRVTDDPARRPRRRDLRGRGRRRRPRRAGLRPAGHHATTPAGAPRGSVGSTSSRPAAVPAGAARSSRRGCSRPSRPRSSTGRARAREAFVALDEADGDWTPPEGLRDAMTLWDFDRAAHVREAVSGLGDDAVAVQEAAGRRRAGRARPGARVVRGRRRSTSSTPPSPPRCPPRRGRSPRSARPPTWRTRTPGPFGDLGQQLLGIDDTAPRTRWRSSLAGAVPEAQAAADEVDEPGGWVLPLGIGLPVLVLLVVAGGVVLPCCWCGGGAVTASEACGCCPGCWA